MLGSLADELLRVVGDAMEGLRNRSEPEVSFKPAPGEWSPKEILGHLIDSAANNHHRLVRAQGLPELLFPPYQQEDWVKIQDYNSASWMELVELWRLYNLHLGHVIKKIPEGKGKSICRIGDGAPMSLGLLVEDYLAHLRHHLRQLGAA